MILDSDRLTKFVDKVCLNCGNTIHEQYEVMVTTKRMPREPGVQSRGGK